MRFFPGGLLGLLLAGAVAACLASQQLYGQINAGGNDPLTRWRESSSGMSTNAALALYRLRSATPNPTATHPRFQASPNVRTGPNYQPLARRSLGSSGGYYPPAARPAGKPFEGIRPAPTAFERYWRFLLEGYEDPETGIIVWRLP